MQLFFASLALLLSYPAMLCRMALSSLFFFTAFQLLYDIQFFDDVSFSLSFFLHMQKCLSLPTFLLRGASTVALWRSLVEKDASAGPA